MEIFTVKTLKSEYMAGQMHVIDCEYDKMWKFLNMSSDEFWSIMQHQFSADWIKISMPGHNYIIFPTIEKANTALDWINAKITALKLSGFVPDIHAVYNEQTGYWDDEDSDDGF